MLYHFILESIHLFPQPVEPLTKDRLQRKFRGIDKLRTSAKSSGYRRYKISSYRCRTLWFIRNSGRISIGNTLSYSPCMIMARSPPCRNGHQTYNGDGATTMKNEDENTVLSKSRHRPAEKFMAIIARSGITVIWQCGARK